jgi:hypothetical protein
VQGLKPTLARPVASRYWPILVLAGCLLIWFLRRPQQVWHPYVWAEESFVVRHFLDGGWLDWRHELQRCADSTLARVKVPIYTDGSPRHLWALRMTPAECRARL